MRLTLALLMFLAAAPATAQDAQPKPETSSPSQTEVSIQGYGDREKTCLEWNDGCRTCRRPDKGKVECSNIGIACQPTAVTCTWRTDPPK
jgi:hypothetical protein